MLGAALTVLLVVVVMGAGIVQVSAPAGEWLQRAPTLRAEVEGKFSVLREPFERARRVSEDLEEITRATSGHGDARATAVVIQEEPDLMSRVLDQAGYLIVSWVIVIALLFFLLARGQATATRIMGVLRTDEARDRWSSLAGEAQQRISHYLLAVTAINASLGVVTGLTMYLLGMPSPLLWGVMAALLNFIPYAGSFVTAAILTIVAFLTFDSLVAVLVVPTVFLLFTTIEGNFVTPMVLGRTLTLDPIAVFLSVLFWGWLWGLVGMVLAVPVLASVKMLLEAVPALRPFGLLLGDQRNADPPGERTDLV